MFATSKPNSSKSSIVPAKPPSVWLIFCSALTVPSAFRNTIQAAPQKEGGQWLTAGTITKEIEGTVKEHKFIRSDMHAERTSAVEFSISKGRQIIDLDGDRIFK